MSSGIENMFAPENSLLRLTSTYPNWSSSRRRPQSDRCSDYCLRDGSQSMLTTATAIFSAIGLLMPGFIIAEMSVARSARGSRSELELALRALSYTLVVHIVFAFWTVHLLAHVGSPHEW